MVHTRRFFARSGADVDVPREWGNFLAAQTPVPLAWDLFAVGGILFACSATLELLLSDTPTGASGPPNLMWLALLRMLSEKLEGAFDVHQCRS